MAKAERIFGEYFISQRNKNLHSHNNLYTNPHHGFIQNSLKLEKIEMLVNGLMFKQTLLYPKHGILCNNEKELTINTYILIY